MENEKVKKIKKALDCWQESVMLSTDENYVSHRVTNREILDYINELESENERLKTSEFESYQELDNASAQIHSLEEHIAELENIGLNENITVAEYLREMQRLKDRVAELEKENAKLNIELDKRDCIDYPCRLIEKEHLKQFAERLKEKMYENENGYIGFLSGKNAIAVDIVDFENCLEETLKEFI